MPRFMLNLLPQALRRTPQPAFQPGGTALVILAFLWMALAVAFPANAQSVLAGLGSGAVVQTEQVRAELIAQAPDGVGQGKKVWAGLKIAHQPHWHTYWKNPGDSGLPTQLQWTLPAGLTAGEIQWPAPQRIRIGSLANYGYEGEVLLPVPLTIGPNFKPLGNSAELQLSASWLVCREECVPQEGKFTLQLPVKGSTALHSTLFDKTLAAVPTPLKGEASAQLEGSALTLTVSGLPAAWRGKSLDVYPETPEIMDSPRTPTAQDTLVGAVSRSGTQSWGGAQNAVWSAQIPLSSLRTESPNSLPFVLTVGGKSLQTVAKVTGAWPATPPPGSAMPTVAPAAAGDAGAQQRTTPGAQGAAQSTAQAGTFGPAGVGSLLFAVAAALLGGLILNLMPCVLPVLAIKVLAFSTPGKSAGSHRAEGLAYTAGVVLSFLALGALVLGLRAAGEQLGWGFQLQSPAVVSALALLFTLIGLNLMGLLELGHLVPSSVASMRLRHPVGDAFLSGVLAVAVASPCTAPFMGASLGYAMALPTAQALAIFTALGLGLALPYLAASWVPGVTRWLPKPGAWMDTFKRFLAFPMWATVVWLVWVLGHLVGVDGAASLLALLLALSLLVWSLGLGGRSRTVLGGTSALLLLALLSVFGKNVVTSEPAQPLEASGDSAPTSSDATREVWHPWSAAAVQTALAAGKPVFVDFTAAWCITCQLNKKTTLSNPAVLADFEAKGVVLMRADWTRRDPAITRALTELGRSGVPVYVLHKPGGAPLVLSEVISAGDVRTALSSL